jgi:DNA-binding PucR family transcriptional regulator
MLRTASRARLSRALVDDLLDGETDAVSPEELVRRAAVLGHDPHRSYRVLALRWSGRAFDDSFIDTVTAAAHAAHVLCWSTRRYRALVVLAQRSDTDDAWADTGVWRGMHHAIAHALPDGVGSIGVGGLAPTQRAIPRSYRQARQALHLQRASPDPHGVTNHDQLGVYGLVVKSEADDFVQEWLAPLLDYDQRHGTELTKTLTAYLKYTGHYGETAAALGIHRSTLRYRLYRIRELTDHDLGDPETRFNLQIATRLYQGPTAPPALDGPNGGTG